MTNDIAHQKFAYEPYLPPSPVFGNGNNCVDVIHILYSLLINGF